MAGFKNFEGKQEATGEQTVERHETPRYDEMQPLFEAFDPRTQGGLLVDDKGRIYEVSHPTWVHDENYEVENRTTALPVQIVDGELVHTIEYPFSAAAPSLGKEAERDVRHNGEAHQIFKNGDELLYPDGSREPRAGHDPKFDPEGFKTTIEYDTGIAFGWKALAELIVAKELAFVRWSEDHELQSANISVLPEDLQKEDVTEHPYVLDLLEPNKMRQLREFGCLSEQFHVLMHSYEALRHAMTEYQAVQFIFGLAGAAAPIRDGSFETTLHGHYRPDYLTQDTTESVLPENDFTRYMASQLAQKDFVPYDWRELSRSLGSPSSGAIMMVPPKNLDAFLHEGDRQLRQGDIISVVRTLGWHTDRMRIDKGTGEICNLPANPNLRKSEATSEMVVKYFIAKQLDTLAPSFDAEANQDRYERAVEIGHINNFFMGVSGKETLYLDLDGQTASSQELLYRLVQKTNATLLAHGLEPISSQSQAEMIASLELPPPSEVFDSPEAVFYYFFRPRSSMNANEALKIAHQVAPELSTNELIKIFAEARHNHVYSFARERGIAA